MSAIIKKDNKVGKSDFGDKEKSYFNIYTTPKVVKLLIYDFLIAKSDNPHYNE